MAWHGMVHLFRLSHRTDLPSKWFACMGQLVLGLYLVHNSTQMVVNSSIIRQSADRIIHSLANRDTNGLVYSKQPPLLHRPPALSSYASKTISYEVVDGELQEENQIRSM